MSAVPTPGVAGAASNVPAMRASSTSNLQPAADSAAPNGVAFQQGSRAAEAYAHLRFPSFFDGSGSFSPTCLVCRSCLTDT